MDVTELHYSDVRRFRILREDYPDVSGKYEKEDALPEARTMANFIALPDGRILNLNGGKMGMKAILPFESTFSYLLRSANRNGRLR